MEMVTWTRAKLDSLKKTYNEARKEEAVEFTFDGRRYYTAYARYLIEFLEGKIT